MADSTSTYQLPQAIKAGEEDSAVCNMPMPVDSAFTGGTLELSGADWAFRDDDSSGRSVTVSILVAVFTVLFIATLNKFINIIPYIFGCLARWKEAVNVESSVQISRSRNEVALLAVIPSCMVAARYGLLPQLGSQQFTPEFKLAVTIAVFAGYVLLRVACNIAGRLFIPCNPAAYKTATNISRTFFTIAAVFAMATAGILASAGVSPETTRTVLLYETGAIYSIFLLRKSQIFANSCSLLYTILYLCMLEFLPTGVLIAAAASL